MDAPAPHAPSDAGLRAVEAEFVRFFVHFATSLNLPRSVGEIFGFLFAAESPQPFDAIVSRLGISKGSASQGLKWLTKTGAITPVYVPRDRRTFYEAETRLRQLFSSALHKSVRPQIEGHARHVEAIEARLEAEAEALGDSLDHYRNRAASLRAWNEKALLILPLLDKLFSLPAPLLPFNLFGSDTSRGSQPPPSS